MARPIHADSVETRRRLVDAALELFAEHGFHGVSTRELAAGAQVNAATLSYYFGGKQGLYDAAVDEVYRRLRERVMAALISTPHAKKPSAARAKKTSAARFELPGPNGPIALDALIASLYRAAREERSGVRLLLRQVLDHGRLTARTEQVYFLPGTESFTDLLSGALGVPVARARLAVVAVSYLLSRYVAQDDASLTGALGAAAAEQAHSRVIASLTATARAHLEK